MTSPNSAAAAKRDLHFGGVGSEPGVALATMRRSNPLTDASETFLRALTDLAQSADGYIRENPWAAIGAVGLAGLTVGYFFSRRI